MHLLTAIPFPLAAIDYKQHVNLKETRMTLSFSVRQTLYYLLWTAAFLISVYLVYINIDEAIKRLTGRNTLLSQMSWLTDRQSVIYSSVLTLVFASLMIVLGHRLYSKNRKGATI